MSSPSIFKNLVLAELQYKQLKTSRITAEDRLNQASLREQRIKKEIVEAESELGKTVPSANAQVETSLAKLLTELNIQLRQQQCLQEAMKGESQFSAQEASKLKLEIEMMHSKLRSLYGTAIVTTPRGKMNNNLNNNYNNSGAAAGSSTEFQTSVITMIGELAGIHQLLLNNMISNATSDDNHLQASSTSNQQHHHHHHPLVPFLPTSEEVPSFSSWDNRSATMANSMKKQLNETHQQLVASLNVICNSCTNLSDDKDLWSSFVDMIAGAFLDACENIISSALKQVLALLHGKKRPRELFAVTAKLSQTCQVVFSPSAQEISTTLRNAFYDRWIGDVFKLPHLHSVLTKKAEITDKSMLAKPFNELLAQKMNMKYLELDNYIERFEKDIDLAHKDIVGEYGFAFAPDIVNLTSAQLFNTQLKLESTFQDRFPLAHGGLQINSSAILDTSIQLLVQQRKKAKEVEKSKRMQSFLPSSHESEKHGKNDANFSTLESCLAAPPASIVPKRSQQDDDLEKLLKRIPSIASKNAVVASPFLPEVWNRVAAPESTPTVIVPLEPVVARSAVTTPPPAAGRARAYRDSPTPTQTPTSTAVGSYTNVNADHATTTERKLDEELTNNGTVKPELNVNVNEEEEEDEEDKKLERKRREAREAAERISNQMKQSAGFFSGGISNSGVKTNNNTSNKKEDHHHSLAAAEEKENNLNNSTEVANMTRKMPPLHPNSGRRPSDNNNNNNNIEGTNSVNNNSGRPSTGPVTKSRAPNHFDENESSSGMMETSSVPPLAPAPQSLTPQEKVNKRTNDSVTSHHFQHQQQPRIIARDDSPIVSHHHQHHHSASPDPSPTASHNNIVDSSSSSSPPSLHSEFKQPYQYGNSFVNNNNNVSQQRKSPTPPTSNSRQGSTTTNSNNNFSVDANGINGRPQRVPIAPRLQNATNNIDDDEDELELLKKREEETFDRVMKNRGINSSNNNNINSSVVGAYGVVAPSPQSARNFVAASPITKDYEKDITDPHSREMIEKMQNNPRPSNSAPSNGQVQNSILQRPKLSTYTQMQQEQINNSNNNNHSMLPSITNNSVSKGSSGIVQSSEISSIHQQRAEREFARREAETAARRNDMQRQIEEEQLEKELARKLKSIEKSSDAKNQDLIRASSREGSRAPNANGNNGNSYNNNGGGGLDLLPPLSSSSSGGIGNRANQSGGMFMSSGGITSYNSSSNQAPPLARPGSGRQQQSNRPGSSNPYTLSPEKAKAIVSNIVTHSSPSKATNNNMSNNNNNNSSSDIPPQSSILPSSSSALANNNNNINNGATYGTPSSALRRKLSLPQQSNNAAYYSPAAVAGSTTPLPSSAMTAIVIEPHEASSLSHLEIYKLACSRLSIKPNSGVVRMLPKNPGEHVATINLDTNYIGNKGFIPLLQVLRTNRGLQFLNLRDNNLESPQICQLCEVLMGAAGDFICQINLSNNPITPAGAASLAELLQRRPKLTSVTVKDTLIQGKSAEQIAELCLRNSLKKSSANDQEEL